jgi:hypothetical protein
MKTIRTAKNRNRFLAAIAESGNITAACEATRLSRAAMYEWRADDPSFAAEWDAALERGLDSLEDELMRRAKDGTLRPVFQGGELVGHTREYSDTLGIFLLKSRRRQIYGDRQFIEQRISLEAEIASMSVEERKARLIELQAKAALVIEGEAVEIESKD